MWPTLISLGPFTIQSFGLLLFLGVFFGGFIFWQKGKDEGLNETELMNLWLLAGLVALISSRLGFILSHWEEMNHWYRMILITKFPGLSYEAALIGFWLTMVVGAVKKGLKLWPVLELAALAVLVVEIFGWLASFLTGNVLGGVTSWWWGLSYPAIEGKRHPVSLLWVGGLMLIYRLLKKWEQEYRGFSWYKGEKNEAEPGFVVASYCLGVGGLRLALAWFKTSSWQWSGDYWWGLSLMLIGGLILWLRSGRLEKKRPPQRQQRKKLGFDFK